MTRKRGFRIVGGVFDEPPGSRTGDHQTSVHAKKFNLNADRVKVLRAYADQFTRLPPGLTDYELADRLGKQQNSVGKRRGELRDFGYIEETQDKRLSPTKTPCIVWVITPLGLRLDRKIREMQALFGETIFG